MLPSVPRVFEIGRGEIALSAPVDRSLLGNIGARAVDGHVVPTTMDSAVRRPACRARGDSAESPIRRKVTRGQQARDEPIGACNRYYFLIDSSQKLIRLVGQSISSGSWFMTVLSRESPVENGFQQF